MQRGCADGDIVIRNSKDSLVDFLHIFLVASRNIVVRRYVRRTKDNCWKLSIVWKEKIIKQLCLLVESSEDVRPIHVIGVQCEASCHERR